MSDDAATIIEPFDVDDGELDGLSPQLCFVLGVEWAMVREALDADRQLGPLWVHAQNVPRLRAMIRRRRGLILSAAPTSDGWALLILDRQEND